MSAAVETFAPVGGPLLTRPVKVLAAIFAAAVAIVLYRFVFGLGSVSALNDGYPWGPWKVLSVIVFSAFASGGYAVALLVYVLNWKTYHALARTAMLTSALGYTAAVVTLGIDIGRPWNFWRLLIVTGWNLQSVLLEIAVSISAYILFLWLEMAPPFLVAWSLGDVILLRRLARRATPILDRAMPYIVAMAIVLPSMHQSSLGSLLLLAGPRLTLLADAAAAAAVPALVLAARLRVRDPDGVAVEPGVGAAPRDGTAGVAGAGHRLGRLRVPRRARRRPLCARPAINKINFGYVDIKSTQY